MSKENTNQTLNFDLPANRAAVKNKFPIWLPVLLVLLTAAVCVDIFISLTRSGAHQTSAAPENGMLPAQEQKNLALKLEKQGLNHAAVLAWEQYLAVAAPNKENTALIWYRIGKLRQDAGDYEKALAAYYRSESFGETASIAPEIASRIQDCLESMGKFAALRHELADRVGMELSDAPPDAGETVLAEIGAMKITKADLDRHIERVIDQQMRMSGVSLAPAERLNQKKALFNQLSSSDSQQMILGQMVGESLLYQKARESGLADDPEIQNLLLSQKKSLLSQLYVEKMLADKITITPTDLETFFKSNKETFSTEENPEPAFEDVKTEVYQTLYARKTNDIRQQLMTQLKDEYDVVIHQSGFSGPPFGNADTAGPAENHSHKKPNQDKHRKTD